MTGRALAGRATASTRRTAGWTETAEAGWRTRRATARWTRATWWGGMGGMGMAGGDDDGGGAGLFYISLHTHTHTPPEAWHVHKPPTWTPPPPRAAVRQRRPSCACAPCGRGAFCGRCRGDGRAPRLFRAASSF